MEPANSAETAERSQTLMTALTRAAVVVALMLVIAGFLPNLLGLGKLAAYLWIAAIIAVVVAARFWAGLPLEQRYESCPDDEVRKKLGWAWILVLVGAVSLLNTVLWFVNEIGFARLLFTVFELLALALSWAAVQWVLRDAVDAQTSDT